MGLHTCAPGLGQIFGPQTALEQFQLQSETQHDVKVVGHLVGISADQRSFDSVNGAIESLNGTLLS